MANKTVAVDFKQDFLKYTTDPNTGETKSTGNRATVSGTSLLLIDEQVIDFFNIPTIAEDAGSPIPIIKVAGFSYSRFSGVNDATGTLITVNEFERMAATTSSAKKVAVLKLAGKPTKTGGKKLRTTSIRFPSFFTIPMIAQALGTMIKKNQPSTFTLTRANRTYALFPLTSTGLFPPLSSNGTILYAKPINFTQQEFWILNFVDLAPIFTLLNLRSVTFLAGQTQAKQTGIAPTY